MLSIFVSTKSQDLVNDAIDSQERLDELVTTYNLLEHAPTNSMYSIICTSDEIKFPIDWRNDGAPFILPEFLELTQENLLGAIYAKLGNASKAIELLAGSHSVWVEFELINRLNRGETVDPEELPSTYSPFDEYRLMHNHAVVRMYNNTALDEKAVNEAVYFFAEAIKAAPNDEYQTFTVHQLTQMLADAGHIARAEGILVSLLERDLSQDALYAIKRTLCDLWLGQLEIPYDADKLNTLQSTMAEVLRYFEKEKREADSALLLVNAGMVAHYQENWSEGLGYFNTAIKTFEHLELEELAAHAQFHKGVLLFAWARKDNPQFYRSAAEALQHAVGTFTRESSPMVFADIQHHLGMIYAEIPDEEKKKSIWAGLSVAAFQASLEIYTKADHPYEYAMVCNHYANALVKYPEAKLSDNLEKALFYYGEALDIRSAEQYPLERSLTLLNSLEAHWHLSMPEDKFDEERYQNMVNSAQEVLTLTNREDILTDAKKHLDQLESLKQSYA